MPEREREIKGHALELDEGASDRQAEPNERDLLRAEELARRVPLIAGLFDAEEYPGGE